MENNNNTVNFNEYNFAVVKDTFGDKYVKPILNDPSDISRLSSDSSNIIFRFETGVAYNKYHSVINRVYLTSSVLTVKMNGIKTKYDISKKLPVNYSIYHQEAKLIPSDNYIEIYIPIFNPNLKKDIV
jgi:hypothetical protein